MFDEHGSAAQISLELSKICAGKCSLCETEENTIIGIGFEDGKDSKRICSNCWKHLRKLALRRWHSNSAVIIIYNREEE